MTLILGIESSCDETAAAVVEDGRRVRSNVIASQHELHRRYLGVVPEIASRAHLQRISPVIDEALRGAGVTFNDLDAVAVGNRPGLIGSLLVGVAAAKAIAWATGKPLIGIDHIRAHLYAGIMEVQSGEVQSPKSKVPSRGTEVPSPKSKVQSREHADDRETLDLGSGTLDSASSTLDVGPGSWDSASSTLDDFFPALGLVVSGGHTSLFELQSPTDMRLLGRTIDDAVGEAYDKAAVILELGYPGGPALDKLAQSGDTAAYDLPRSLLESDSLDFSYSGLKTALLYTVRGQPQGRGAEAAFQRSAADLSDAQRRDLAASFQAAAIDTLVIKLERALDQLTAAGRPPRCLLVGGGVSANSLLRQRVTELGKTRSIDVRLPPMSLCLDNAAMIAGLAYEHFKLGRFDDLDLSAVATSGTNKVG